ncbi:MAG: hypothetical protein CL678_09425 [Bdellovibrionaceae bacterium]|nr:hypothetical protein [Pseudobdellovibrionaceae bacterium]|tara:strand:+ start:4212 stop:4475 length:264 start_codon:yes stop_codon:yes gene_type:complete
MNKINKIAHVALLLPAVFGTHNVIQGEVSNPSQNEEPTQKHLNQMSLTSIEESYLQVDTICKARAFNADPIAVERELPSVEVSAIYS